MNLEKNWPFILLIWAGGIILAFFFLLQPLTVTYDELNARRDTLEREAAMLRQRLENLVPLERKLVSLQETAEVLEARLPEQKEIPDLLKTIEQAAQLSNVEIRSLTPQPTGGADNYTEVPFDSHLFSRYYDLLRFLNYLRRSQRLIQVRSFNFRKDGEEMFQVNMHLSTYTVVRDGGNQ